MNAEIKCPENLYDYYRKNPSLFEEKANLTQKIIYGVGLLICSIIILFPAIISEQIWVVRLIAGLGLTGFWFGVVVCGKNYFSRKTGGAIKPLTVKKFDMDKNDESDILDTFFNKDFEKLASFKEADDQPVQLCIHEDPKGKIFYCQLMKYFSSSDFRGLTDVIVLKGGIYYKYESIIRGICPTK